MSEQSVQQDAFHDIRPYRDSEVAGVLQKLIYDDELVSALTQYQFPKLSRWFSGLLKPVVRIALAREFGEIENVRGFQELVAKYMAKMIGRTTTKLSVSGIDQLEPDEAYLFISNHRDIAMDPAFVNWALYKYGMNTVRIAIGDNLLRKPYVSDLMRLNKSFIVKRSVAGRELMKAMGSLSAYIDHSLVQDEESVWIAQREGRAKDGNDRTEPALIKMIHMAQRKEKRSVTEMVERLKIVPVAISYEYDPCDAMKARELNALAEHGSYEKAQYEDIDSIVKGITGHKGHVHVSFGEPLSGVFDSAEAVAAAIDAQIYRNYRVHETNRLAAGEHSDISTETKQTFAARSAELSPGEAEILRQMYANPVHNQKAAEEEA